MGLLALKTGIPAFVGNDAVDNRQGWDEAPRLVRLGGPVLADAERDHHHGHVRQVRAAVVLALDGPVGSDGELDRARTEIYVPNEFVAAEVAKHPELRFGASVNP